MTLNKKIAVLTLLLLIFIVNAQKSAEPVYPTFQDPFSNLSTIPYKMLEDLCMQNVFRNCEHALEDKTYNDYLYYSQSYTIGYFVEMYVVYGIVRGDFTNSANQEAVLVLAIEGTDGGPIYVLLEQIDDVWQPVGVEQITRDLWYQDVNPRYPMVFETANKDSLVVVDGVLMANEMYGRPLSIQRMNFESGQSETTTIFEMPKISNWWDCNNREIPNGEPFASFRGAEQKDINQDGYLDIQLNVGLRYWNDSTAVKSYNTTDNAKRRSCDKIFNDLFIEQQQVNFYFDGKDFHKGENADWLLNLYNPVVK